MSISTYATDKIKETADSIEGLLNGRARKYIEGSHYDDFIRYVVKEQSKLRFFGLMVMQGVSKEQARSLLCELLTNEGSDLSKPDRESLNQILVSHNWRNQSIEFDPGIFRGEKDELKMKGFCRLFIRGAERLSERLVDQFPFIRTCTTQHLKTCLTWNRGTIEHLSWLAVRGDCVRERGVRIQANVKKLLLEFGFSGREETHEGHNWDWVFETKGKHIFMAIADTVSTGSGITNKVRRHGADIESLKSVSKKEIVTFHLGWGAGFKRRASDLHYMNERFDYVVGLNPEGLVQLIQTLQRIVGKKATPTKVILKRVEDVF